jgi:hypothetical protein
MFTLASPFPADDPDPGGSRAGSAVTPSNLFQPRERGKRFPATWSEEKVSGTLSAEERFLTTRESLVAKKGS